MDDPKRFVAEFDRMLADARETIQLEIVAYVKANQGSSVVVATALRQIADEIIGREMAYNRVRMNEMEEE